MELIVCAHKGEAQAFIKFFELKKRKGSSNLYQGTHFNLLICAEGLLNATAETSWELGKINYHLITNIGVAGQIKGNLKLFDTIEVRTSYGLMEQPLFHSFSSNSPDASVDCLTTNDRIISMEAKKELIPFAHLIDRELYGIAYSAKKFMIDWRAIKCISDLAYEATNCQSVFESAEKFSLALLNKYLSIPKQTTPNLEDFPNQSSQFHFTFSMKKEVQKLIKKASLINQCSSEQIWEELKKDIREDLTPKQKAREIIKRCKTICRPDNLNNYEI